MPIEQIAPEMEHIGSRDQEVEVLGSGYGGAAGPAEGPLWWKEGGYLLFSDIGNNRRMKWAPGEGVTVFHEPTNNANGLTRDPQGRLIACERGTRHGVTRLEPDGSITVVANRYQDKRLNRPNDVVVKSDGSIYFTDPGAPAPDLELDFSGVYRVSPDLGTITLLVRDFITPNGLAFSPDESVLYIDDSRRRHIRAFDVQLAQLHRYAPAQLVIIQVEIDQVRKVAQLRRYASAQLVELQAEFAQVRQIAQLSRYAPAQPVKNQSEFRHMTRTTTHSEPTTWRIGLQPP